MAPPEWFRVTGARVKTRDAVGGNVTHVDFRNKKCRVDFDDGEPKELDASKLCFFVCFFLQNASAVRFSPFVRDD